MVRVELVLVGNAGEVKSHGDLSEKDGGDTKEGAVFRC